MLLGELEWKNPAYNHPPQTELLSVIQSDILLFLFHPHLSPGLDVYSKMLGQDPPFICWKGGHETGGSLALALCKILCGWCKWCLTQPVPQHSQALPPLLHTSEAHPCSLITNLSIKNTLKRHSAKGESQLHLPLSRVKARREQPSGTSETPAHCVLWLTFPSLQSHTTGLG